MEITILLSDFTHPNNGTCTCILHRILQILDAVIYGKTSLLAIAKNHIFTFKQN